jgi:hypothetical protein
LVAEIVHVEHGENIDAGHEVVGRDPEDLLSDDAVLAPEDELQERSVAQPDCLPFSDASTFVCESGDSLWVQ